MSIHVFHSKLMSGKEEGTLFEGLRRLRGIGKPALAEAEGWTYWTDGSEGATTAPGWTVWEDGSEALSRA
jgi:hypothetical protein